MTEIGRVLPDASDEYPFTSLAPLGMVPWVKSLPEKASGRGGRLIRDLCDRIYRHARARRKRDT